MGNGWRGNFLLEPDESRSNICRVHRVCRVHAACCTREKVFLDMLPALAPFTMCSTIIVNVLLSPVVFLLQDFEETKFTLRGRSQEAMVDWVCEIKEMGRAGMKAVSDSGKGKK